MSRSKSEGYACMSRIGLVDSALPFDRACLDGRSMCSSSAGVQTLRGCLLTLRDQDRSCISLWIKQHEPRHRRGVASGEAGMLCRMLSREGLWKDEVSFQKSLRPKGQPSGTQSGP